jgi:uncharacterized protein with PIN domain
VSRIQKAYESRIRSLLQEVGARRVEQGLRWHLNQAEQLSVQRGIALPIALGRVSDELASKLRAHKSAAGTHTIFFWCDAGLGGLARWLRAAGCEAEWRAGIADDELLREAQKSAATVLTTDSLMMERRVIRDGVVRAFWLPPTLKVAEQLRLVFREFGLRAGEPRCMECGGELQRAEKESLRDRIPPRTYRWLDEYFLCSRCGKLFWRGTHWEKIGRELKKIAGKGSQRA